MKPRPNALESGRRSSGMRQNRTSIAIPMDAELMTKSRLSLSERIAERAKKTKKQARGGANRAAFLAHKDEIANAIADGWPVKDIWQTLSDEGAITFSYDSFIRYVRNLITDKPEKKHSLPGPETLAAKDPVSPKADRSTASTPQPVPMPNPTETPGFKFNPKPNRR